MYEDKDLKHKSNNSYTSLKKFIDKENTLAKFDKLVRKLYVRYNR